ncbi:MAG: hypothetical protein JOZ48_13050, partial [Acidobacteriaceae bacterium]|nr:hypothetical protein [Acidobacteriaceae bacterium]
LAMRSPVISSETGTRAVQALFALDDTRLDLREITPGLLEDLRKSHRRWPQAVRFGWHRACLVDPVEDGHPDCLAACQSVLAWPTRYPKLKLSAAKPESLVPSPAFAHQPRATLKIPLDVGEYPPCWEGQLVGVMAQYERLDR